jgi:hypothetical protein
MRIIRKCEDFIKRNFEVNNKKLSAIIGKRINMRNRRLAQEEDK